MGIDVTMYRSARIPNLYPIAFSIGISEYNGDIDEVIPIQNMISAKNKLIDLGANVTTFKCIGVGHSIDKIGISKGIEFIKKCKIK